MPSFPLARNTWVCSLLLPQTAYDLSVDIADDLCADIAYDLCLLPCQGMHRSCSQALWLPDFLIIRCTDEYPDQDLNGISNHASL